MSLNSEASTELIVRAQQGDRLALTQLLNAWHKRIYNYALRYSNRRVFAEEVVQKTFIQVYQKIDQLHEVERFNSWLYRIASNQCHSQGRSIKAKQNLVITLPELPDVKASVQASDLCEENDQRRMLRSLMLKIPSNQREVIIMKEYEGLKFREIAEVLEESENTVKSRLYYGLKALRKIIIENELKEEIYHG